MRLLNLTMAVAAVFVTAATASAQKASTLLSVHVESVAGDDLAGQALEVLQTDFSVGYGNLRLDGDGNCSLKVYEGNHKLNLNRPGFLPEERIFCIEPGESSRDITIKLTEKTRRPFALTASQIHDAYSGANDVEFTWNVEPPVFFDDFESYSPFAISFGDWTGLDGDLEAAAPLMGSYPNRGVMQYAQIINPLTVTPTWWYDYPVLRPYGGQQYVGFTRTSSGNPNDDWLISPVITPGTENFLSFMAKAADRWDERFLVYVTTTLDSPRPEDFKRIDTGNFESVGYTAWQRFTYSLADYESTPIRFAIRYVSDANRYGAFMLMVDDVYVGPFTAIMGARSVAKRVTGRSAANPNEEFTVYLDGIEAGKTESYDFTFTDVTPGVHTLGVEAVYRAEKSELSTIEFTVSDQGYASLTFAVEAESLLSAEGTMISLVETETAQNYMLQVADGSASIPSLPEGRYLVDIAEGAFERYAETIDLREDTEIEITLQDRIIDPYNLTAKEEDGEWILRWNRRLGFIDSFEDYDDFASGEFGGWTTIDLDGMPVYPIGLNSASNIVSFPGSGTATNPTAIPPMVFNPWATTPPMMPADPAIAAPDGDKTVIFFSPQYAQADKWLISPEIDVYANYSLSFKAKAYSSVYPESIQILVSTAGAEPSDFEPLAEINQLTAESWSQYIVSLEDYEGMSVRIAIRYTSYDAFIAQVDDVRVENLSGDGPAEEYGNVVGYEVSLDGKHFMTTNSPEVNLGVLENGIHTAGITTIYKSRTSNLSEITFGESYVMTFGESEDSDMHYDPLGRKTTVSKNQILINGRTGKKILER